MKHTTVNVCYTKFAKALRPQYRWKVYHVFAPGQTVTELSGSNKRGRTSGKHFEVWINVSSNLQQTAWVIKTMYLVKDDRCPFFNPSQKDSGLSACGKPKAGRNLDKPYQGASWQGWSFPPLRTPDNQTIERFFHACSTR